jgi:predicted MFS family arabinose efflux permease
MTSDLRGGQGRLLVILGFSFAVEGALYSAVTPILPLLTRRFSLSDSVAGLLLSGYSAGLIIGSLLCVAILKRANARGVAAGGLVALAASTILFAWSGNGAVLISARLAGGTAAGAMWTACVTWLLNVWADDRRGAVLGTSMSFGVFGALAGPAIGTVAVQFGVRLPYSLVAILCLVAAVYIFTLDRPPDGWEGKSERAGMPPRARRLALLAGMITGLAGVVMGLINVAGPLVLTRLGGSDLFGGLVFLAAALFCGIAGRPMGRMIDRWGTRRPLLAGLLSLAVLQPVLAADMPPFLGGVVVAVLVVGNTLCYIGVATMLTRTGQVAGWGLRFSTALVATAWGTGETLGAICAGVGLDHLGTMWTTIASAGLVVVGIAVLAVITGGREGRGVDAARADVSVRPHGARGVDVDAHGVSPDRQA